MIFESLEIKLVLRPIATTFSYARTLLAENNSPMAVSSLSPVATQTLIPARFKSAMASGTPSCKRSSMAVAPNNRKSCSISSYTASTLPSRSSSSAFAFS